MARLTALLMPFCLRSIYRKGIHYQFTYLYCSDGSAEYMTVFCQGVQKALLVFYNEKYIIRTIDVARKGKNVGQ